jgi:hypothetical protein
MAVHVCVMAGVFMIGVGDTALRISDYHRISTPAAVLILTVAAAVGVCTGGFFGGTPRGRIGAQKNTYGSSLWLHNLLSL